MLFLYESQNAFFSKIKIYVGFVHLKMRYTLHRMNNGIFVVSINNGLTLHKNIIYTSSACFVFH